MKLSPKRKHTTKTKDIVVFSSKPPFSKKRAFVFSGSLVLIALFFAVGLSIGNDKSLNQANAGGEATLGRSPAPADDEQGEKITPLDPLPSNDLYSIRSLSLGTNKASIAWNLAQGSATASGPFPRNGIYRITYTETEADATSWKPVNKDTLGKGLEIRYEAAHDDVLAQWTPVGYDNGSSTQNILPDDAHLGQVFSFRLELQEPNGTWKQVDKTVLKLTVPYPDVKLAKLPTYTADTPWSANPLEQSFEKQNPIITIFWYGNSDDSTAPYTYLYVSSNADMSGKQKAVINNIITNETFDPVYSTANASYFAVAQEPAQKKYYAVFNHANQRLSSITLVETAAK